MISLKKAMSYAASEGIEDLILRRSDSAMSKITLENGVHEDTTISNDSSFSARGALDGHLVYFRSDTIDQPSLKEMVTALREQSKHSQEFDTELIIEVPDLPYQKNHTYNPKLEKIRPVELVELGKSLHQAIASRDSRIVNLSVTVGVVSTRREFLNSRGLALKSRGNYVVAAVEGVVKDGEELQSHYMEEVYQNLSRFKPERFAKAFAGELLGKLGTKPGHAGTFSCVLTPEAHTDLVSAALSHLSMFTVSKDLSLLKDQLDQQVFSPALTVREIPNSNDIFAVSYDDEGYPTEDKTLVEKGVIRTYLYDQEMAKKYRHQPTGNGFGAATVHPALTNIRLEPGLKKRRELIAELEEGYLIDFMTGAHAGLDARTGNFTLSASGFYVKGHRIKHPVQQFTVSGNIIDFLKGIAEVGSDSKKLTSGDVAPSILVRDLVISC